MLGLNCEMANLFKGKNADCPSEGNNPCYAMKIYHLPYKVIPSTAKRFETNRPRVCKDNKPHCTNHGEVIYQDKCQNAKETVILTKIEDKNDSD